MHSIDKTICYCYVAQFLACKQAAACAPGLVVLSIAGIDPVTVHIYSL